MRSCTGTDGSVCRESQLQISVVLSNGNGLCTSLSGMSGLIDARDELGTVNSCSVEAQYCLSRPVLIWISARISETEETSLHTQNVQSVYVVRKGRAYWRSAGVHDWLPVLPKTLSSLSTNSLSVYFRFGTSRKLISVW